MKCKWCNGEMIYSAGDSDLEDELGGSKIFICENECSCADENYSPRTDYPHETVHFNYETEEEIVE